MLLGSGGARSVEKAVLDFVATRVREMQVRCGTDGANPLAETFPQSFLAAQRCHESGSCFGGGQRCRLLLSANQLYESCR